MQTESAHIGISVVNLEETVAWYKSNFGAQEIRRTYKKDPGLSIAVLKLGPLHLELLQPDTPEQTTRVKATLKESLQRAGACHVALTVPDVKRTYDKLKATGTEMVTELVEKRLFFCRDPNGVLIEIKQER